MTKKKEVSKKQTEQRGASGRAKTAHGGSAQQTKKRQKSVASKVTIDLSAVAQHLGMMILVAVIVVYVGLNALASQLVDPLYRGVVAGDDRAWVLFLKIAPQLPEFETEIAPYIDSRFAQYAEDLTADDLTRKEKIAQLEALLDEVPNAPAVLYALSSLYAQGNETEKAEEYREQAQARDPEVGRE